MTDTDFPAYLAMKSDPFDVLWSGFDKPPEPVEFESWFRLARCYRTFLLAEAEGVPVGYQQIEAATIGPEAGQASCSYGVAAAGRGKGYCALILRGTVDYVRAHMPSKIVATWIADDNIGSIKCAKNAGWALLSGEIRRPFALPSPQEKTMRRYGVAL